MIAVLWLCGPPGVGKTAVGWEIYSQLVREGLQSGFVDIDQLGMCYPEPKDDPGRHWLKARNLAAVVAGYRSAGAGCVVVSGVIDTGHDVPIGELPGVALTVCRLRADRAELAQRYAGRQPPAEDMADVLQEAADLDASGIGDLCVDTGSLSVADVARRVRAQTGGWPVMAGADEAATAGQPGPGHAFAGSTEAGSAGPGFAGAGHDGAGRVLWLCGATGVGKSAVGFSIYVKTVRAGLTAAYVDLDQIGFCGPAPAGHLVKARNLAAMWHIYRQAGAQALVISGPAEDEPAVTAYAGALAPATLTLCRLHAEREQLTARIMRRGQGRRSWAQPGDPLLGQPTMHLRRIADQAARNADALNRAALGHRIDTDGRTVDEIADLVTTQTDWPRPTTQPDTVLPRSDWMT